MKPWQLYVVMSVICWGAYVPTLHHGQMAFGKNSALRAFLFVCVAYSIISVLVLSYLLIWKTEPFEFPLKGVTISYIAGCLGAIGALGIVFALKPASGGAAIFVAPLVFAGAPIMNTFVSMLWKKPAHPPSIWFYAGIALAAGGAALVLRFKPT